MQDTMTAGLVNEPLLSEPLLRSLRELNRSFLTLLRARVGLAGLDWALRVPQETIDRMESLSDGQSDALAQCPYALFDLRFSDDAHWKRLLQRGVAGAVRDVPPADAEVLSFVTLILFFCWHMATSAPMSTLLVLGMNEATSRSLAALTVDRVTALAEPQASFLSLRWAQRSAYWQRIIATADEPLSSNFRRAQLFGLQIAAADHLA